MSKIQPTLRRAIAYCRVSVDEEAGNNASIASQEAEMRRYADNHGIEIVAVVHELDISGRKIDRPAFNQMIRQACADDRPVDLILAYSLSRFARRLLTQMTAEHQLAKAGIQLVTVVEGEANDPQAKFVRNLFGCVNEKYALDASSFTRKDRRHNAGNGYWNGGPVPFGYKAVVAVSDGKKDRKKLAIVEGEAEVVRLIYRLSLNGLDGQPMGTRSLAAYLNGQGYSLRGKPFRHSNVDGILTREHYTGQYFDRTSPIIDAKAKPEHAIAVPCPQIIAPDLAAAVAARRAKAAPRVTPPRITNSPTLLGGIGRCGVDGCNAGLTLRSGKGGRYTYYTCNHRAEAAGACPAKPIRTNELDDIVLDGLFERVLRPARLKQLLAQVLELSDAADAKRQENLDRVRRERVEAENKLRRLLDFVAEGMMSSSDAILRERLADYRASIASLAQTEENLRRSLSSNGNRIDNEKVAQFAKLVRGRMSENAAMRKAYVRLLIDRVTVRNDLIVIEGSKAALEAAVGRATPGGVPRFDREWCRLQDSNL